MGWSSAAEECESTSHSGPDGYQLLQTAKIPFGDLEKRDAIAECSFLELDFSGTRGLKKFEDLVSGLLDDLVELLGPGVDVWGGPFGGDVILQRWVVWLQHLGNGQGSEAAGGADAGGGGAAVAGAAVLGEAVVGAGLCVGGVDAVVKAGGRVLEVFLWRAEVQLLGCVVWHGLLRVQGHGV